MRGYICISSDGFSVILPAPRHCAGRPQAGAAIVSSLCVQTMPSIPAAFAPTKPSPAAHRGMTTMPSPSTMTVGRGSILILLRGLVSEGALDEIQARLIYLQSRLGTCLGTRPGLHLLLKVGKWNCVLKFHPRSAKGSRQTTAWGWPGGVYATCCTQLGPRR